MNFLGHLLVSGDDPLVITGNFMADAVKGRDLSRFDPRVQQGIRLHRRIDAFTDTHPITLIGRDRLRAQCGKYAGVALDLFYDHIIASEWNTLRTEPLPTFAQRMYRVLHEHSALMPERTRYMLPFVIKNDWLSSYATIAGTGRALAGLSRRVPAGGSLAGSEVVLAAHIDGYRSECLLFLRELNEHLAREEG